MWPAAAAAVRFPHLVGRVDDHLGILTASHELSGEPVEYLEHLISDVPFSPLLASFGAGVGVGVGAVDALRGLLPGCQRLRTESSAGWPKWPEGSDVSRYRRLVEIALRQMRPPLDQVRAMFELTNPEIAALFGVKRQAVEQWEQAGDVPAARREKLANLLSVGESGRGASRSSLDAGPTPTAEEPCWRWSATTATPSCANSPNGPWTGPAPPDGRPSAWRSSNGEARTTASPIQVGTILSTGRTPCASGGAGTRRGASR